MMMNLKDNIIVQRFNSETPHFWKKVGRNSLYVGLILGAIATGCASVLPAVAVTIIATVGGTLVVIGQSFAKLTTNDPKVLEKEKMQIDTENHKRHVRKEKRLARKAAKQENK